MIIAELLGRSSASQSFRDAVRAFLESGAPNDHIQFSAYAPLLKVERTLIKLLEEYPGLEIERVVIDGRSGCEFFRGQAVIQAQRTVLRVRFHWDCRWRAEQEGWTDYFGFPDQIRAAREFGHDCFREWAEMAGADPMHSVASPAPA